MDGRFRLMLYRADTLSGTYASAGAVQHADKSMTRLLHYSYLGACWVALAGFGAANPTFHSVPAVPAWARDAVGPRSPPSEEVYTLAVEAWRALAARQPPIDDESASQQRFSTE
jgi:hypothetical protein